MSATAPEAPRRLVSLDAFRGFVMLFMVSDGLGLSQVARQYPDSMLWGFLDYQTSHVPWVGCSLWDLIQPSFMFIVGVAMPYSFAARTAQGQSAARQYGHVLYRAALLILLGVFLRSNGRAMTNWTFEDVITQIGLGYAFVFLFLGRGWRTQIAGVLGILVGYWLLFVLWPAPSAEQIARVPADWDQLKGFGAHWNKHLNPAGYFDVWFMNLFPRASEFTANGGGYQTLSFIPSMATTLIGVVVGEYLRGPASLAVKILRLAQAGAALLVVGMLLDGNLWRGVDWQWTIAPVVKRIWSPSWVLFAAGWTLVFLAAFLWVIDLKEKRALALPLVIVGMNSIAMYVMHWLFDGWVEKTLLTHFGAGTFDAGYMPIVERLIVTGVLWYFCYWLYKRKVFIRI